jgi:hypothetical protein
MAQSEDFDDVVSRGTAGLDRLREAGLRGLEAVTVARQAGLEREKGRLAEALGDDDPRVMGLSARLEEGRARLRTLAVERARAGAVVKADSNEWVLHGYVWTADGNPVPNLSVVLVNPQGQWLRELGFAGTDARGYFQLRAPAPAVVEAHISISDRRRAQVHRSEDTVSLAPGRVEYREVTLGKDGTRGPVPPGGTKPRGGTKPAGPAPDEKKPRRRS